MNIEIPNRRAKTTMVFALPKTMRTERPAEQRLAERPVEAVPTKDEVKPGSFRRRVFYAAVAFGVVALAIFLRLGSASGLPETGGQEALRRVNVIAPERAPGGEIVLPATVQAYQATDLFARANGFLKAWHFDIGAQVKAGQLLAEIETPELDQELLQALATFKQAEAEKLQAVAELDESKADVAFAEANVVRAKADMDYASGVEQRSAALVKTRAIAPQDYESDARARLAKAAEWESAKAELVRRKTNLATRKAIIESRAATVQSRKASVDRLRDLTGFQKIFAPFDGIITRRRAEVGMLVSAGSGTGAAPLFSLAQVDVLRVHVAVPQSSALDIRTGDQARITIPEKPGQTFDAKVTRTAGAVDPTSRSLLVEVELANDKAGLFPGSYAQVRFQAAQGATTVIIPAKTLMLRPAGPHVAVVGTDNVVHIQRVTLGRDKGTTVEVLGGLEGPQRLIANPADDLREGETVQVSE